VVSKSEEAGGVRPLLPTIKSALLQESCLSPTTYPNDNPISRHPYHPRGVFYAIPCCSQPHRHSHAYPDATSHTTTCFCLFPTILHLSPQPPCHLPSSTPLPSSHPPALTNHPATIHILRPPYHLPPPEKYVLTLRPVHPNTFLNTTLLSSTQICLSPTIHLCISLTLIVYREPVKYA
jgi:hypothetical protein